MKRLKKVFVSALGVMMATAMMPTTVFAIQIEPVEIVKENFTDDNFREYVKTFDVNEDNILSGKEIYDVTEINIDGFNLPDNKKIERLDGIENFVSLEKLDIPYNNVANLELDSPNLEYLNCENNKLTELTVTSLNLEYLYCCSNKLTELTVTSPKLVYLDCEDNELTTLNVNSQNLVNLYCQSNHLTSLDTVTSPKLEFLDCRDNELTELTVRNPNLEYLYCDENKLTELTITSPKLELLACSNNELTELTITSPNLWGLNCYNNGLTTLNVNGQNLQLFNCSFNDLTSLDISNYPKLEKLYAFGNHITNIDTSNNPELNECYYAPGENKMDVRENFDYTKVPSLVETMKFYMDLDFEMTCEDLTIDLEKQTISLDEGKDYGQLIFEAEDERHVYTFYYGKNPNQPEVKPEVKPSDPEDKPIVKPETKPEAKPETKPETKPTDTKKPVVVEDQKAPQTSDTSNMVAYISMMLLAAATGFAAYKHKEVE